MVCEVRLLLRAIKSCRLDTRLCQLVDRASDRPLGIMRHAWMVPRSEPEEEIPMHKERLLDWATANVWVSPIWLEIVASHAHRLSAIDRRNDAPRGSRTTDESRKWMNRIRPEMAR
jgi:hypothetical protein